MSLVEKLHAIAKSVDAVERKHGDEDPITFTPADLVLDVVRDELRKKKVLALPAGVEILESKPERVRVRLAVTFIDAENVEDSLGCCYAGEGESIGAAETNALKGLYLVAFNIETVEPADLSRREKRQRAVRRDGIASAEQIRHRIRRPMHQRQLTDEDTVRIAKDLGADIERLEDLPRRLVDPLRAKILKLLPPVVAKA